MTSPVIAPSRPPPATAERTEGLADRGHLPDRRCRAGDRDPRARLEGLRPSRADLPRRPHQALRVRALEHAVVRRAPDPRLQRDLPGARSARRADGAVRGERVAVGDHVRPHRPPSLRIGVVDRLVVVRGRHRHEPDGRASRVRGRHRIRTRDGARDPASPADARAARRAPHLAREPRRGLVRRDRRDRVGPQRAFAARPGHRDRRRGVLADRRSSRCCSPTPARSRTTRGASSASCRCARSSSSRCAAPSSRGGGERSCTPRSSWPHSSCPPRSAAT